MEYSLLRDAIYLIERYINVFWQFRQYAPFDQPYHGGINSNMLDNWGGTPHWALATNSDAILLKTASTESGYFLYSLLWSTVPHDFFGIGYISLYNLLYATDASLATLIHS